MATYQLCRGVSLAAFDDCVIVLDVRADRYWRLDGRTAHGLQAIAVRADPDPDALAQLLALRLCELAGTHPGEDDPIRLPTVTASASEAPTGRMPFAPVTAAGVFWSLIAARLRLRWQKLDALLVEISQQRRAELAAPSDELRNLATMFKRYRRLVPIAFRCLPDSLAFLRFAARRGFYPYLVIAVEAHPFAAHCWVQAGDVVLYDSVDHASVFKPIRVV